MLKKHSQEKLSRRSFLAPSAFMRWSDPCVVFLGFLAGFLFLLGLPLSLVFSPQDYLQGELVRIMYVHVPAAWMASFIYLLMAIAAFATLATRHPLAAVLQKAACGTGVVFTTICLATGAIWGQAAWGTWWEWDARMTSVLILLLIYLGVAALWRVIDDPARAAHAAAVMTLVGAVNLPIIKFSVDWWNTLHQPAAVLRLSLGSVHPSMLAPLLIMIGAFKSLAACLILMRMQTEILSQRLRRCEIIEKDRL